MIHSGTDSVGYVDIVTTVWSLNSARLHRGIEKLATNNFSPLWPSGPCGRGMMHYNEWTACLSHSAQTLFIKLWRLRILRAAAAKLHSGHIIVHIAVKFLCHLLVVHKLGCRMLHIGVLNISIAIENIKKCIAVEGVAPSDQQHI